MTRRIGQAGDSGQGENALAAVTIARRHLLLDYLKGFCATSPKLLLSFLVAVADWAECRDSPAPLVQPTGDRTVSG
jgi:hypothetical protein